MAKQIGQQSTTMYLLILFVFLFLIGFVLAAVFYSQSKDNQDLLTQEQQRRAKDKGELDKLKNEQVPALTQKITTATLAWDAALKEADEALKLAHAQAYANVGLVPAVKGLNDQVTGNLKRIKELEDRTQEHTDALAKKDGTIAKMKSDQDGEVAKLRQDLRDARTSLAAGLADKDAQLQRAVEEKDAIIKQREQEKAVLAQEKDTLTVELQKRDVLIRDLQNKLRDEKRGMEPGKIALRKPDGRIAKVLPDQQLIFIDLGDADNIKPGLPMAVYAKETGIPQTGEGKAKLVVVNVGPTTSECRIVEAPKDEPIVEGDLVANIVFDTSRVHDFVVEGEFDLYGEGRPDPLGSRRVRKLIEDYGGKLAETVSVDTDFVVMGEEPPRPPQPAADAPPADFRIYQDKMKKYNRYKQIQAVAITLQIPVLNTTRFLAFSGYVPMKRLTD